MDNSCKKCGINFTMKRNYNRHMKKFHPKEAAVPELAGPKCSLCGDSCMSIKGLQEHIQKNHEDIELCFEEKTFYTLRDFNEWKVKTEADHQSLFVKHRADRVLADGRIAMHFFCHRSGFADRILPAETRKRPLKYGSQKIGFYCPAHIVAFQDTHDGIDQITVNYQSVHIGHVNDLIRDCLYIDCPDAHLTHETKQSYE